MIDDLDETIRQLLVAEIPIKNGEVNVAFDQPKREWSARLSKPTINLFLYDVRENNILRQHQWERLPNGNGRPEDLARLKRTPFRVDCIYMLTTWANDPEDEHRLLCRAMLALFRFPGLPEDRLVGAVRHPTFEIQARLAVHDRLTNPAEVWSSLDNELRPSIPYIVTMELDPWTEITGPLVGAMLLRLGQAAGLPDAPHLMTGTETAMVFIGGTVHAEAGGAPLPDVEVTVEDTRLLATTDLQGRFVLGSLPPGSYRLLARSPGGQLIARVVTVPGKTGDYDMILPA